MSSPGKKRENSMSSEEGPEDVLGGQIGMFDFNQLFDGSTKHAEDALDFSDEDELAEENLSGESKQIDGRAVSVEPGVDNDSDNDSDKDSDNDNDNKGVKGDNVDDDNGEDDDLMKELEMEGMQGVQEDGGDMEEISGGLFGNSFPGAQSIQQDLLGEEEDHPNQESHINNRSDLSKEEQQALDEMIREKRKENNRKLLHVFYPSFRSGKPIKMQTLFPIAPLDFPYQQPPRVKRPLIPTKMRFEIQSDSRKSFRLTSKQISSKQSRRGVLSLQEPRLVEITDEDLQYGKDVNDAGADKRRHHRYKEKRPLSAYDKDLVLATADWDDDAILEGPKRKISRTKNIDIDDWDEGENCQLILDGLLDLDSINLRLDSNDPGLLLEDREKKRQLMQQNRDHVVHAEIPLTSSALEKRFNISNDSSYDILKKNYHTKVRSTIGNLTIEHAPPALRLQSPFYPVKPASRSLRMFHRPQFSVSNLTTGDSAQLFFMEYSEENPIALNKPGMCSKLINYYRKVSEGDSSRPKLPIGETHVLGLEDRSPFWNFGSIERGNIVPTLYNQMVRAPIFKHDAASTDFLLVRSAGAGMSQRYFLRAVNNLFTVGQTFPAVEVPGPHSRKVSAISKNRLKMIVYRILNADEHRRLLVKDISRHFPEHTDMQNRQRLKEFMEYQRSGEDQGFWKVKAHEKVPGFIGTRAMISPEDICLLESMQSAQQRFDDVESFRRERLLSFEGGEGDKEKHQKEAMHAEETQLMELAPWNTTRNFIQATQGKAMLQIHGQGDPSSRGDAFSFLKISMKGGFLKNVESEVGTPITPNGGGGGKRGDKASNAASHSYNVAEQQKLYDEEISKVWYRQQRVLSSPGNHPGKPRVVDDEEMKDDQYMRIANQEVNKEVDEKPRYLKITRMVRNGYGILERRVEIVRDPKVVELYVRRKQALLLEDPTELDSNSLVLTNDAEENLKVKKRLEEELAKLQKQHEKKKKKSPGITAANIDSEGRISGKGIGKGKSTSRRCATCGMLGHIRTNKSCPLYYTIHNKSNPNYVPGSEKSAHLMTIAQEAKK
ncbi:hypothetical protein FOA43_001416 [Brettanomyces nanus]|uniref:Transcription initiation factor TFIID subunit 1 histone acetyltransferase domain-containing protein n=1 Tax=Eeniella nana TaxID=13502 RepID=A0A875S184_EENNA|nr:uncharacterized protein FOA43_001416 [Brettanomyces nanus]QPG74095.1 hypothetical protein FOA43_001416 [Brettanomyces nanus]